MAKKKSLITTFRLNEDDYLKLKELKEKSGTSWTKLVAHVNLILEKEMKDKNGENDHDK